MQKIYIIKHKQYHSHEKKNDVPLFQSADIILISHWLTQNNLYKHFVHYGRHYVNLSLVNPISFI